MQQKVIARLAAALNADAISSASGAFLPVALAYNERLLRVDLRRFPGCRHGFHFTVLYGDPRIPVLGQLAPTQVSLGVHGFLAYVVARIFRGIEGVLSRESRFRNCRGILWSS